MEKEKWKELGALYFKWILWHAMEMGDKEWLLKGLAHFIEVNKWNVVFDKGKQSPLLEVWVHGLVRHARKKQ